MCVLALDHSQISIDSPEIVLIDRYAYAMRLRFYLYRIPLAHSTCKLDQKYVQM